MIVTVTMNPAIDKTVEIDSLVHGGLNRIKKVEYDAGGKGINVSKTIKELGGDTVATGFIGGNNGRTIVQMLKQRGITTDFINVDGETRTNTKVFEPSGELTELNEPGPEITNENIELMMEKIERYAVKDTLFVLSGSIPSGVDNDIYARIIKAVHKKGAKVLLDADGEVFRKSLEAVPDIIKPNIAELQEYADIEHKVSDKEIIKIADGFIKKGIKSVAVSMGKSGAIFILEDYKVKCPSLLVKSHSTVGAGDAMVAALAYCMEKKYDKEETVRMCMAVSAGAVTTTGTKPPSRKLVEELKNQVIIEKCELD